MAFSVALTIYSIFLFSYLVFIYSVIHHINKYQLPNRNGNIYIRIFIISVLILATLSIISFFKVPWVNLFS